MKSCTNGVTFTRLLWLLIKLKLGLCDNRNSPITIMLLIITIIMIVPCMHEIHQNTIVIPVVPQLKALMSPMQSVT